MMYNLNYYFFDNKLILNLKIIINNFIFQEFSIHIIKTNYKSYSIDYKFNKKNNNKYIMK